MEIPPSLDTDAEDVAWALQTAASLWKRNERADAIVWLRRAAQAAGDAMQDDRALALARHAAELSDWMAQAVEAPSHAPHPSVSPEGGGIDDLLRMSSPEIPISISGVDLPAAEDLEEPPTLVTQRPVIAPAAPAPPPAVLDEDEPTQEVNVAAFRPPPEAFPAEAPSAAEVHKGLLDPWAVQPPPVPKPEPPAPLESDDEVVTSAPRIPAAAESAPEPPQPPPVVVRPALPSDMQITREAPTVEQTAVTPVATPAVEAPPTTASSEHHSSAPAPAKPKKPPPPVPKKPPPPKPQKRMAARRPKKDEPAPVSSEPPPSFVDEGEKLYVADSATLLRATRGSVPTPPPPQVQAEVAIPRAPSTPSTDEVRAVVAEELAEARAARAAREEAERAEREEAERAAKEAAERAAAMEAAREAAAKEAAENAARAAAEEAAREAAEKVANEAEAKLAKEAADKAKTGKLDLDAVNALADLPDDARAELAACATVHELHKDEEIGQFALAMIVAGEVDVAAQIVDAPAERLRSGTVLRARGSLAEGVPLRLICASAEATIATWDAAQVEPAFKTCPWVEDDLRAQADRVQALVGVTLGPLADRLDTELRRQVTNRLTVRELGEGEVVIEGGQPVKQMLIVGQGNIELVDGDDVKGSVGAGELLFASEILGGGAAAHTARAGKGGAIVLFADRSVAQELMVTCPPLLEIFAGM